MTSAFDRPSDWSCCSLVKQKMLQVGACCVVWSIAVCNAAWGQPAGQTIEQLQSQLESLQNQIQQIQQSQDQDSSRVRSLGSQRPAKPVIQDDAVFLKMYDLSDIFTFSPQYPAILSDPLDLQQASVFFPDRDAHYSAGGFGGGLGGSGVFNFAPQQPSPLNRDDVQVSIKGVIDAIKANVQPAEWSGKGGASTISQIGNMLLVSAKESTHEQIAALLDLFREKWGARRTVSVKMYWIRSDAESVRQLLEDETQIKTGVGVISDDLWSTFLAKAIQDNRLAFSGQVVGHNGQTLHAIQGTQIALIVEALPITNSVIREDLENENHLTSTTIAGLRPIRQYHFEGVVAELTPLATRGGNFVTVDFRTQVSARQSSEANTPRVETRVQLHDGQIVGIEMDNSKFNTYRLSTSLRCPIQRVVLAGGMAAPGSDASGSQMFVFVQAALHTIREDVAEGN